MNEEQAAEEETQGAFVWRQRTLRGVCASCGGERTNQKFKKCLKCRKKERARKKLMARSLMCANCKAPVTSTKLCDTCRAKAKEKRDALVASWIEAGLCTNCGRERKSERLCARCLKRISLSRKATRERRLADGKCAKCGARDAIPETTHCFECRDTTNARYAERKLEQPSSNAANAKRYRADCKAKGICYKCGVRKAAEGKTRCDTCLEAEREARRVGRAKKKAQNAKRFEPNPENLARKIRSVPGRVAEPLRRAL